MTKNKLIKILRWLVPLVLIGIIAGSGYQLVNKYLSDQKAAREYQELKDLAATKQVENEIENSTDEAENEDEVEISSNLNYPDLGFDFQKVAELNEDFVGWLYYPGLDINYPILQGDDNNYYLDHSFRKQKVNAGCIFMDYGAASDWSDRNTFVFGHSMRDGSMFGSLRQLIKEPEIF
ncbi:MAG: class B sortase, partial [Clostridiales bacterium]|nr:class B sortase [Clostridiales bacterium]